jgi:surface carbohydrate biosynthesis protein
MRLLYLPVETKARELLGKIFLAARAVERGWTVILGESNQVREFMRDHQGGAYIEIGIPEKKAKRLKAINALGNRIANMCEEGLIYADGRDYCNRKLGPTALAWTDRLLVVGSRNADHLRTYRPASAEKIVLTGNPRFDTLLPELRSIYRHNAETLRKRFGRFVLINTNFTRANPFDSASNDRVAAMARRNMIGDTEHAEFFRRFIEYQTRLMIGLQELIKEVKASAAVDRIVVRPHPVENVATWRQWAEPLNIDVYCEGSAIDWMLAAEAVLHPGCTTAIEGLLLDRPVFSYVPEPDSEFINPSDAISEWVTSATDFLDRLLQTRGQDEAKLRALFAPQRQKLEFFVTNVNPPYASDRILDELERLDLPNPSKSGLLSRMRRGMRQCQNRDWEPTARKLQKFPGLTDGEVALVVGHWLNTGVLRKVPRIEHVGRQMLILH